MCTLYTVLAFAFFHALWTSHPAGVMQLSADQYNFAWLLQWTPWAILHGHDPFFTNYLNYPFGVNLLTNAGIPGLGVLFSPITLLFGPVVSFNAAETLSVALAAISGYVFALRWVSWRPGAFVAGLLFGFSPYELAQTGHLNLTFIAIPPLMFLAVHEIIVRQRGSARRAGLILGFLTVAQYFVSSELLFDTVVVGAIAVIVTAICGHRSIRSHLEFAWKASLWAAVVVGVLLVYPVWYSVRGAAHISGKIQLVPQGYRADLFGPFVPDSRLLIAPTGLANTAAKFASSTTENGSYLGIALLAVLAVGTVVLWRKSVVKVAAIGGLAAFILSLGSGLTVKVMPSAAINGFPLPGRILAKLPLLSNAIPARFALLSDLFAALMLALILQHVHAWARKQFLHTPWPPMAVPGAVAVFALVLLIPAPLAGIGPIGTPSYFTSSAVQKIPEGSATVLYPYNSNFVPNPTIWQAIADLRFPQPGTSLLVPSGPDGAIAFSASYAYARTTLTARTLIDMEQGHQPAESPTLRAALLGQFHQWKIENLVAFPAGTPNPPQTIAFFTWLFGRSPITSTGGAYGWYKLPTA